MLKFFRKMFDYLSIKPTASAATPLTSVVQEDPRLHEVRKRVRDAFNQQQQQMNARALKPHSVACKDPVTCMKKKCFKWAPDKIVSSDKVVETADQIKTRMSKKKGIYKS